MPILPHSGSFMSAEECIVVRDSHRNLAYHFAVAGNEEMARFHRGLGQRYADALSLGGFTQAGEIDQDNPLNEWGRI